MFIEIICVFTVFVLSSCTINVTLAHTEGYANDLVDETASTEADPDFTATVPMKGI